MKHSFLFFFLAVFITAFSSCKTDSNTEKSTQPKTEKKTTPKQINSKTIKSKKTESPPLAKSSATSLAKTVTIGKINYRLIDRRLLEKINVERSRLGLSRFSTNANLNRAAKIHNDYMVRADILDHNQSGTSTPTMRDRVTKAGGKFRTAGENIQYEGFIIRTINGAESIIAPTYEELTEQLWQNWKTSPPHYKNLINPEFTYLGTALKWSDKKTAVFATQVYGG